MPWVIEVITNQIVWWWGVEGLKTGSFKTFPFLLTGFGTWLFLYEK